MTPLDLNRALERAFREGYAAGYDKGSSDSTAYEWGCALKRHSTLNREADDAWLMSEIRDKQL